MENECCSFNIKETNDRWKYRRKIAFSTLAALLFLPYVRLLLSIIFPEDASIFKVCDAIIITAIPSYTSIVLAYFGLATWDDKVHRRKNNHFKNI